MNFKVQGKNVDFKGQRKYVFMITKFLMDHILSLKGIDKKKVNRVALAKICFKTVCDMLSINYHYYSENGLFDKYSLEQIKNGSRAGELQAFVDEFIVTRINITRFLKDDLSDIFIQVFGEGEESVCVARGYDSESIIIKSEYGHELRYQDGRKMYFDGERVHEILELEDMSLKNAFDTFELFKANGFVVSNQPQLNDGNMSL